MIIDCAVHPVLASERFNTFVGGPWNLRQLPTLFGEKYGAPFDQLAVSVEEATSPAAVAERLQASGVDCAILCPTTFGYWPNPNQAVAVARAANRMLLEDWLDVPVAKGRFLGSIRIALNDVDAALQEIDRCASDERFVQIVVPARALATYGDQRFFQYGARRRTSNSWSSFTTTYRPWWSRHRRKSVFRVSTRRSTR